MADRSPTATTVKVPAGNRRRATAATSSAGMPARRARGGWEKTGGRASRERGPSVRTGGGRGATRAGRRRRAGPGSEGRGGQCPGFGRGQVAGQDEGGGGRRERPVVGPAEVVDGGRPQPVLRAGGAVSVGVAGAVDLPDP